MESVRKRILEIIEMRGASTAGELARTLDVTPADIRHHLRNLVEAGSLTPVGKRPPGGRGRPRTVFQRAKQPDNIGKLMGVLLHMILEEEPEIDQGNPPASPNPHITNRVLPTPGLAMRTRTTGPDKEETLRKLARTLAGNQPRPEGHISRRLFTAVGTLNAMHYQARWEAQPDGPMLILGHCPYAAIIHENPSLCQLDTHLIETLTAENATHLSKLEMNPQGLPVCKFLVG